MFFTLLVRSLTRGWKRKMLVVLSSAFGAALIAAMLNISLDVGDKMNMELKRYGANLIVIPQMETLPMGIEGAAATSIATDNLIDESALSKIKMIFWRNNIVEFTLYLEAPDHVGRDDEVTVVGTWFDKQLVMPTGETVKVGMRHIKSWWNIEGVWPSGNAEAALAGKNIAQKLKIRPGRAGPGRESSF